MFSSLDRFPLFPHPPETTDRLTPRLLGFLDPLHAAYANGGLATSALSEGLDSFRAKLPTHIPAVVENLTHGSLRALPIIACRRDFLFLEAQIVQVLVTLTWLARLLNLAPSGSDGSCDEALTFLAKATGTRAALETVLASQDASRRALATMELLTATFDHLHQRYDFPADGPESWFRHDYQTASDLSPLADANEMAAAAEAIAHSLSQLPGFEGVLIVGSFAEPAKRDGFNDLDLACSVAAMPDAAARAAFLCRLGLTTPPRSDNFEYLRLGNVNTHLSFALLPDQEAALSQLQSRGDESASVHFLQPGYAPSAYHVTRGRVLLDPRHKVRDLQRGLAPYPKALEIRLRATWAPIQDSFLQRLDDARRTEDRVYGLIAGRYAREAAYRLHFAAHQTYANPIEPKWFAQDGAALPPLEK